MKCETSGSHTISYQSLLLSTIVLNDSREICKVIKITVGHWSFSCMEIHMCNVILLSPS